MSALLYNATILTPTEVVERGAVVVSEEGRIAYVGRMENAPRTVDQKLNLSRHILTPGLIDVHVHGGHGVDFSKETNLGERLSEYSRWVVSTGVTGFLCSIAARDHQELCQLIEAHVAAYERKNGGAEPLGLHLEGPYLNRQNKSGAFNPEWLRDPSMEEAEEYLKIGKGWIRVLTLDPELPEADKVASLFRRSGVVVALGHTNAGYETASEALRGDYTHVTHMYNAQRSFGHRAPGTVGAVFASDRVTVELIADTIHVHPAAMKVLMRCIGTDRVVLITDAMAAAGLDDGRYHLVGQKVVVKGGRATLENGTLAGSTVRLTECVKNMVTEVGIPLNRAVQMASLNAASAMGLSDRLGSIAVGKDANLVVLDKEVNVLLTMVRGKIIFNDLPSV